MKKMESSAQKGDPQSQSNESNLGGTPDINVLPGINSAPVLLETSKGEVMDDYFVLLSFGCCLILISFGFFFLILLSSIYFQSNSSTENSPLADAASKFDSDSATNGYSPANMAAAMHQVNYSNSFTISSFNH